MEGIVDWQSSERCFREIGAILVRRVAMGNSASFLKQRQVDRSAALCVKQQTWPIFTTNMDR